MQAEQPVIAAPRPSGAKNVSLILSGIAVVLAAAALVAAVAIPGPTGATGAAGATGNTGATGPRGPAGNNTLMARFISFGTITLGSSCVNASQSAVLKVPSGGNVTITASVTIQITHTAGTSDTIYVYVSTSRFGACSDTAGFAAVPASAATDTYAITVPVAITSPVATAGTYSYTVGALAFTSTATMYLATGYAVFYPG